MGCLDSTCRLPPVTQNEYPGCVGSVPNAGPGPASPAWRAAELLETRKGPGRTVESRWGRIATRSSHVKHEAAVWRRICRALHLKAELLIWAVRAHAPCRLSWISVSLRTLSSSESLSNVITSCCVRPASPGESQRAQTPVGAARSAGRPGTARDGSCYAPWRRFWLKVGPTRPAFAGLASDLSFSTSATAADARFLFPAPATAATAP